MCLAHTIRRIQDTIMHTSRATQKHTRKCAPDMVRTRDKISRYAGLVQ